MTCGSRHQAALGALLGLLSCAPGVPPCPAGLAEDPAREAQIRGLLKAEGLRWGRVRLCFGGEPGVQRDGLVTLDAAAPAPEQAATLAHLLEHRRLDPIASPCAAGALAAQRAEAQGRCRELAVREALGVPASDPAEPGLRALAPDACREALLHSPGVRAATTAWRARCGEGQAVPP